MENRGIYRYKKKRIMVYIMPQLVKGKLHDYVGDYR